MDNKNIKDYAAEDINLFLIDEEIKYNSKIVCKKCEEDKFYVIKRQF